DAAAQDVELIRDAEASITTFWTRYGTKGSFWQENPECGPYPLYLPVDSPEWVALPASPKLMGASASAASPQSTKIEPTSPASLSVRVGDVNLTFDPPEIQTFQARIKDGSLPDAPQVPGKSVKLTPLYDSARTHILGNLYFTFQPETLRVAAEDGTIYTREVDFIYNEMSGTIDNKDGKLKGKINAEAKGALQRLDLIQADAAGKFSVKKGSSAVVCPQLPQADAGYTAVAGIYIAPWRIANNPHLKGNATGLAHSKEYAITRYEILPIRPEQSVQPANPDRVAATLSKLRQGKPVKIALMGDSILLGAESTRWWEDKYDAGSLTWKGRFIHELRQRFPTASIEVIEAYRGGVTIDYGLEKLTEILEKKPDLIVASFGVNDSDPKLGKRNGEEFGATLGGIMDKSMTAGADFLFVIPFPLIPWLGDNQAERLETEMIPAMRRAASNHGATLIDVNTEYRNLNSRGIPWWSQSHNWHNHPGDFGHQLYAETVLRAFPR
ncbi:MAG: SGNH/GDSL hydrolase family protein, partial [Candidatus Methylacidiphilales bacterium]|nr:SGNH/GDSL hydrolase family protein [Candidatus Methylacidiphilales bacterium]